MLSKLPTWLRAAVITSGQTLAGAVTLVVLDVLFDVQDWVSDPTNPVDISGAGVALATAGVAFATGVVTAVFRYFRPVENTYPEPPTE